MQYFIRQILFAFLILISTFVIAQDTPKPDQKEEVLRLDTNLVLVDVNITSKTGAKNPANLQAQDFAIYEDGVRQKIENFSSAELPFNVAILIDTSGSAKDEVEMMKKAVRRFMNELRPQDRVALIELNQRVTVLEELTADREKIDSALAWLQPGTGTAFYDALQLSIEKVFAKVEGRKAIIALTDGVDSAGVATYDEILPELEKSMAATYFLELNTEATTEAGMMMDCEEEKSFHFSSKQLKKYLEEYADAADTALYQDHCRVPRLERLQINKRLYESARKELRELAEQTGGRVYPCKRLSDIEPAYAQIAAELRTQYSLGYYPSNEKKDGKWRTLKIELKRPGLIAKTKPGYRAPSEK